MPREVVERLGGNVLDSSGDVKSEHDYSDGFGNIIELPDEPELPPITVPMRAEVDTTPEQVKELTALERAQETWDNLFDEFDNNAPSTDIARERMISKYGPRPEAEVRHDIGAAAMAGTSAPAPQPAVKNASIADRTTAHNFVEQLKSDSLQRRLDEIDANPRLRQDEKESQKLLLRARHKAQEDIRRRELDQE